MVDTIDDAIADDIENALRQTHNVQWTERNPRRFTVHFQGPATMATPIRKMLEMEAALIRKYCNAPYLLYVDSTTYRFTMACN